MYLRVIADNASHARLDAMGEALLDTLHPVFPYTVKMSSQSQQIRSIWCTEKVHFILYCSHNLRRVGRSRNITCQVTESRLKALKAKGHMTNRNPDTYGMSSIMRAEVRECAAQEMAREADTRDVIQPPVFVTPALKRKGKKLALSSLSPGHVAARRSRRNITRRNTNLCLPITRNVRPTLLI